MTEKKRGSITPISVEKLETETDRQFLEKTHVSSVIKTVLSKLIENRPDDPIAYLADYFENVGDKGNKVQQALQLLTDHSKPAFDASMSQAFDILSENRIAKSLSGVNGSIYMELLNSVIIDFPEVVKQNILRKISVRSHEAVSFDVFKCGIFTCSVLKDYLEHAKMLYNSLDLEGSASADKILCEAVLNQLFLSISVLQGKQSSVMESGYALGPDKLYIAINKAASSSRNSKSTMTSDEFYIRAADSFLLTVKPLQ